MINHIVQDIRAAIVCDRHNYTYCTNNYRVIVTGVFYIMRVTLVPGAVQMTRQPVYLLDFSFFSRSRVASHCPFPCTREF